MEIIDSRTVEQTYLKLSHGKTLNHSVSSFLKTLEKELNTDDFVSKGISATAQVENATIEVGTPHGKVVGIVQHVNDKDMLAARVAFSAIRVSADGKTSAIEVMSLKITWQGFITGINDGALNNSYRVTEADFVFEICFILLACLQDKLPKLSEDGVFG